MISGSLWLLILFAFYVLNGCTTDNQKARISANVVEAISNSGGGEGDQKNDTSFARAYEPIPFVFPRDHGAHPAYRTEWWYYTGNLTDSTGRIFGYQLTFFRSALTANQEARKSAWATNQVYMAHFAISDATDNRHLSFERYSRGDAQLAGAVVHEQQATLQSPLYQIWLEDWAVQSLQTGEIQVKAHVPAGANGADSPAVAIDFNLLETRQPILHGKEGLSQKGAEAGNASYYYSLVGLQTSGLITIAEQSFPVQGISWMDHEFGTSALSKDAVGWDWLSLQLENGAVLMIAQIRTKDGGRLAGFESTWIDAAGRQQVLHEQDFNLEPLDYWSSPRTNSRYPARWRLTIPSVQLEVILEPIIADQEMQVTFVYWEGAVLTTGHLANAPITGSGYVELTGYDQTSGRGVRE